MVDEWLVCCDRLSYTKVHKTDEGNKGKRKKGNVIVR